MKKMMKTKLLILFSVLALVCSCEKEYNITARLIQVWDNPAHIDNVNWDRTKRIGEIVDSDYQTKGNQIFRGMGVCYKFINHTGDSLFIPYNVNYKPKTILHIQGQDSIRFYIFGQTVYTNKMWGDTFAPGDTIYFQFSTVLSSDLTKENKWLNEADTYSIYSRLNVNVTFDSISLQRKDKHIPNITFVNDSNGVLINPKVRTSNKQTE